MHRTAEPHEIGDVVAMVASSRASYLTGANIILDGGRHRQYYALKSTRTESATRREEAHVQPADD